MSAIIIAICILPIIMLGRKQSQKKKRIRKVLSEIAKTKSREVKTFEICGQLAVAMTENEEAFVFYKKEEDEIETKIYLLLREYKNCNLIRTSRNSSSGNIGRLALQFESVNKDKPDVFLEFYNASESFQLVGELQLLEKWKPIIDRAISA